MHIGFDGTWHKQWKKYEVIDGLVVRKVFFYSILVMLTHHITPINVKNQDLHFSTHAVKTHARFSLWLRGWMMKEEVGKDQQEITEFFFIFSSFKSTLFLVTCLLWSKCIFIVLCGKTRLVVFWACFLL